MSSAPNADVLRAHHVLVRTDNAFQRTVRLCQALWREKHGYPIGQNRGQPLGTRLQMPEAKDCLSNYLTEGIRQVVRAEVINAAPGKGRLFARPRIFNDLLSSQPLCFNLFGELKRDPALATRVLGHLLPGRVVLVRRIEFEHSPGRLSPMYTADKSAFDVFVEYESGAGGPAFLGIEVKYHEALRDELAAHRARYDEIAAAMGCFHSAGLIAVRGKPINQLWRDHLLAGSMLLGDAWKHGMFVVLYPADNGRAASAVEKYRACLSDTSTFDAWTLERLIGALEAERAGDWVSELRGRYLPSPDHGTWGSEGVSLVG